MPPIISKEGGDKLKGVSLRSGQVYRVLMYRSDGLELPEGVSSRNKLTVIIGVDTDFVYGCVLINTRINQNIARTNSEFYDSHYPLSPRSYPEILDHPSHVFCGKVFPLPKCRFTQPTTKYLGLLSSEDLCFVTDLSRMSSSISIAAKRRFGLL